MRAAILTTLAAAQALLVDLDAALGYPRDGVNAATGLTELGGYGRTLTWAIPVKHPTRAEWAVAVEARIDFLCTADGEAMLVPALLTKAKYDALKARVTAASDLPSDWFPASI